VEINGHWLPQLPTQMSIKIFRPQINLQANAALDYAAEKSIIPVKINWENTGSETLIDQRLRLQFSLPIVNLSETARLNNCRADTSAKEIVCAADLLPALTNGTPGTNQTLDLKIVLLSNFVLPAEVINPTLQIIPLFEARLPAVTGQTYLKIGTPATIPIATTLSFTVEPRYYTAEGDQIGRGPLPPQVGQTTKYWIFAQIDNTVNAAKDVNFNTALPENVEFTGKQSVTIGPKMNFDAASRRVSWVYHNLPPHSQTGLYFEVAVTPTPTMVGKNITLTGALHLTAADAWTDKVFSFTSPALNNTLPAKDTGAANGTAVTP